MILVLNWASRGLSEYAPSWPHLDLVTLVPNWASWGPGSTAWPAGWPHLYLVSWVATWASPIPGDSGPHVGLLDLVNLVLTSSSPNLGTLVITWASPVEGELVPIWASPSPNPGYFVPHLELIAVDSFFASPATGDSDPICASPRSGDSGPHLGIIGTW